jgi:uncharacterized protein YciI
LPWFVKLEEGIVDKAAFDAVVPEHLAWLRTLEAAGHEPSSGYWGDRKGLNGQGAGGMLLFQAASMEEAEAVVQGDPLIQHGCVRWTLHEWRLVFGPGVQLGSSAPFRSGTAAPGPSSAGETPVPRG